ncbi:MAG: methyl-accepting chemotaxis protein [Lachnospiraceae bacterium]
MFGQRKAPCQETDCIFSYVDKIQSGVPAEPPSVDYPIHQRLVESFKTLFSGQKEMGISARKLLTTTTKLSSFDVEMSHSADALKRFANDMATVSESNLAVVEQTTASMNQVNETIAFTSATLNHLSEESSQLVDSNNEGLKQIAVINELKDEVIRNSEDMSTNIDQLVEMTHRIGEIVAGVEGIAQQTNLLALNASIEAARAGEFGRGFAVVAEEIRKLSDSTQQSLDGMMGFVSSIRSVANKGKSGMENTLQSTRKMGQEIEAVQAAIIQNVEMLENTVRDVVKINNDMKDINVVSEEINDAMEMASADAERLSEMTQDIHRDASHSTDLAKQISAIDNELSEVTRNLMGKLSGVNALSNAEFLEAIANAITAHESWVKKLKKMVETGVIEPIQTDGHKCAFGHFYHTVTISSPVIKEQWNHIDAVHNELHQLGHKVMDAIRKDDIDSAQKDYLQAELLSRNILETLREISTKVQTMDANRQHVFEDAS